MPICAGIKVSQVERGVVVVVRPRRPFTEISTVMYHFGGSTARWRHADCLLDLDRDHMPAIRATVGVQLGERPDARHRYDEFERLTTAVAGGLRLKGV